MERFTPDSKVTPGVKTVADLIADLQKLPQDAYVMLSIMDPNEAATTFAELEVSESTQWDNVVDVRGDVFSDDPEAYAPWAHD